ncbi:uncharacterized protein LOC119732009 [Patiria miniata]|uniref:TASOR PIN domain-containing protein n=1 Tax=Patiria miniata TaxID=46514 RepID=A0A914ACU1_PATMI|nr:uncharacterized protein LOC119732009 [Patiria miniata]
MIPVVQGTAGGLDSNQNSQQLSTKVSCLSTDGSDTETTSAITGKPIQAEWDSSLTKEESGGFNCSGGQSESSSYKQPSGPSVDRLEVGPTKGQKKASSSSLKGIVIPDELLLMTCIPDELKALCKALQRRSSWGRQQHWRILLGSEIVVKMDQVRQQAHLNSQLCYQANAVLRILSRYRSLGLVHLLPGQQVDGSLSVKQQIDYIHKLRIAVPNSQQCRCIWLTDLPLSNSDLDQFKGRNINVYNIKTLLAKLLPDEPVQQAREPFVHDQSQDPPSATRGRAVDNFRRE